MISEAPDGAAPEAPVEIPKNRTTILIVEDHADMLESIQTLLELSIPNVRTMAAPDAASALKILAGQRVQLIVSDYQMPGMDGIEFLRKVRQLAPHVARVLLTAHPRVAVAAPGAAEAGIHELLVKPVASETLVKSLAELLERKSREELVASDGEQLARRAEHPLA